MVSLTRVALLIEFLLRYVKLSIPPSTTIAATLLLMAVEYSTIVLMGAARAKT